MGIMVKVVPKAFESEFGKASDLTLTATLFPLLLPALWGPQPLSQVVRYLVLKCILFDPGPPTRSTGQSRMDDLGRAVAKIVQKE
jgi:hypothetical protein